MQPLSAASASKPKQRQLTPVQTFCENSTAKAPEGLAKGKESTITDHKQQGTTILAQLLTQGMLPFQLSLFSTLFYLDFSIELLITVAFLAQNLHQL